MRNQHSHVPKSESSPDQTKAQAPTKSTSTSDHAPQILGVSAAVASYAILNRISLDEAHANEANADGSAASVLPGVVDRIELPSTIYVHNRAGSSTIHLARDATFLRDGPATLSSFVPGDKVVAEGAWVDGIFIANKLVPLFEPAEGPLLRRNGNTFVVPHRIIKITPFTRFQDDKARLIVGKEIFAVGRLDPVTDELVAGKIGLTVG